MTPIIQTKLHGNGVKGNCLAAALASLLDLPIEAVPAFEDMPQSGECDWNQYDDFDWWRAVWTWLYLMGYDVEIHTEPDWDQWPAVVKVGGGSPRFPDCSHAVLWSRDGLVHDPHPDGTGIVGDPFDYWVITPRKYTEAQP